MLKLVIADDEKIIRETINSIIDWEKLDIEVIGLCQNGIEAYNLIIDESPDIVLVDLKMPGMSGLDLIEKVQGFDPDIQFIILSGYGEFEFAKAAMRFGVRQYLLKPCSEQQIEEAVRDCIDRARRRLPEKLKTGTEYELENRIRQNVIYNLLRDCLSSDSSLDELMKSYESVLDFRFTPYRIVFVYYLQETELKRFLNDLEQFCREHLPGLSVHGIYVTNTLLLFFKEYKDYADAGDLLCRFAVTWTVPDQVTAPETRTQVLPSLYQLIREMLPKIRRYDSIYYVNNFHAVYSCNYQFHIKNMGRLLQETLEKNSDAIFQIQEEVSRISDLPFLKQILSSIIMKLSLNQSAVSSTATIGWISQIDAASTPEECRALIPRILQEMFALLSDGQNRETSQMTAQIHRYVSENLSNPDLNLKYICENVLYMNVDYVSKKYMKENGIRFSQYLSDCRIARAKEMLLSGSYEKMQDVADAVGMGNSPQYFSQLFKKATGMTPSAFLTANRS